MDEKKNEIILFENQGVKLEVNLREDTVWLTQAQMEELFDVKHATISEHISNIFREGELDEETSVGISDKSSGGRKSKLYNLDVIISVAIRTMLISHTLDTSGTVLEARGLASRTYTVSPSIAYCIFIRPHTFISTAIFFVYSLMVATCFSVRFFEGRIQAESPE